MHADSGLKAVRMAQLFDEFEKVARYDDDGIKIVGMDGTVHYEDPEDQGGARPEVDRVLLREIFLDSLKPDTVKWVLLDPYS